MDKGRIVRIKWTEYPTVYNIDGSSDVVPRDFSYSVGQRVAKGKMVIDEITWDVFAGQLMFYIKTRKPEVHDNGWKETKVWNSLGNLSNLRVMHECDVIMDEDEE